VIDPTGDEVLVDAIAIQQVVFNLVRNALQAMADRDERHLRIWSKLRGAMVEVVIEDSGTGITPDHEEQLFLPFNTKKINGLGLGLTIVKMIVEAHGGRIGVGASAWGGCAFRFTIPVVPSMMEGANERGSESLSDR
jgi:two-component system sensor kinase FixL